MTHLFCSFYFVGAIVERIIWPPRTIIDHQSQQKILMIPKCLPYGEQVIRYKLSNIQGRGAYIAFEFIKETGMYYINY